MAATLQGYNGYIGFGVQSVLTTAVTPTVFQHVEAGVTLKENQPGRAVVPGIIKGRRFVTTKKGNISGDGSIPMILRPDDYAFGRMWADILGSNNAVSGDAADAYTHTFGEGTNAQLPAFGLTIEEFLGGAATTALKKCIGAFVKKITITKAEDDVIKCAVDWIFVKETLTGTIQSATYTTEAPFENWMATVKIGATIGAVAESCVKDWTFEYDTMVKLIHQDCGTTNGRYASVVSYGVPVINLSFNKVLDEDWQTIYNYFKNNTENAVQLNIKHTALAGSNAGSEYEKTISLPKVMWTGETPNIDAEEDLNQPMQLQALYDATETKTIEVVVKNSESGTYSV
jgi:hypothetical protein